MWQGEALKQGVCGMDVIVYCILLDLLRSLTSLCYWPRCGWIYAAGYTKHNLWFLVLLYDYLLYITTE